MVGLVRSPASAFVGSARACNGPAVAFDAPIQLGVAVREQHRRITGTQLEHITDLPASEINPVDGVGQLSRQPHSHVGADEANRVPMPGAVGAVGMGTRVPTGGIHLPTFMPLLRVCTLLHSSRATLTCAASPRETTRWRCCTFCDAATRRSRAKRG